jgi:hypothetical protein
MGHVDLSPEAIVDRLKQASDASDLRAERRLDAKLDMSAAGIERRLREVSELLALCESLGAATRGLSPRTPGP